MNLAVGLRFALLPNHQINMSKRTLESFFPTVQKKPKTSTSTAATTVATAARVNGSSGAEAAPTAEASQRAMWGSAGAAAAAPVNTAPPMAAATEPAQPRDIDQPQVKAGKALAGPFAAAAAAAVPSQAKEHATPATLAQWHEDAERRLGEAQAHVEAAAGKPQLAELLVEPSWQSELQPEFQQPYFKNLQSFLEGEWQSQQIFPPQHMIFRAMNSCPFDKVKVVILGQDPYHNTGQAMGMSFSVPQGVPVPPSLQNMYKELKEDLGCSKPSHGCLHKGVLLLNTCLTVRAHNANSHAKKGWESFTDKAIAKISQHRSGVVFLLWGKPAQAKAKLINQGKHHVLMSAHPSGLSAHRGFFGSAPFSKANRLLAKSGMAPIDWQIE